MGQNALDATYFGPPPSDIDKNVYADCPDDLVIRYITMDEKNLWNTFLKI